VKARSAGVLLHRVADGSRQVLLGHMGGPFWANKDAAAWSIPKGGIEPGEDALTAAMREFAEELGVPAPSGDHLELGPFKQSSGKVVWVWAVEGDLDPAVCVSATFKLEWPRGSGRVIDVPELDRVAWFDLDEARVKLVKGQAAALDALLTRLGPAGR
jgi:predicted NUDIX family NTP pyrophosphohydrolase